MDIQILEIERDYLIRELDHYDANPGSFLAKHRDDTLTRLIECERDLANEHAASQV